MAFHIYYKKEQLANYSGILEKDKTITFAEKRAGEVTETMKVDMCTTSQKQKNHEKLLSYHIRKTVNRYWAGK